MKVDVTGKVALVTGGSRGIGAATVRLLHRSGASVFFTYVRARDEAQRLKHELGDRVECERCDLGNSDALPAIVEHCVARYSGLDVLVNNAALYAENRFDGSDYARWRAGWARTFAVNLFGAADLAWLALPHMRKRGGGRIVNVASRSAHRGELTYADYAASKAALVNLTKSLARAEAEKGIAAFAVAPGFIDTEMPGDELRRRRPQIEAEIPSGRVGTPEEVAQIVLLLASGLADYATGTTIDVNGASYVR